MSIRKLFEAAIKFNASDLFIGSGKPPSFRISGAISMAENIPPTSPETINTFRQECIGETGEAEYLATGGMDCAFAHAGSRFRINFYDSINGPCLVARPIRVGSTCDFATLSLPVEIMTQIATIPRGMIIVTGTTGSGKSTTMSAIINYINNNFCKHILTLEDPIEYIHQDKLSLISQREVGKLKGGFAAAGKSGCDRVGRNPRSGNCHGGSFCGSYRTPHHLHHAHVGCLQCRRAYVGNVP